MTRDLRLFAAAGSLLLTLSFAGTASAQKHGGILKNGALRQPREHVDARGIDAAGQSADVGPIQ